MTPEAQQIAIAEACGWTKHSIPDEWSGGESSGVFQWKSTDGMYKDLPDLNDLNFMHEAEKTLSWLQKQHYATALYRLMLKEDSSLYVDCVFHATTAQRAEAFLRVSGKWDTTK